RERPEEWPGVEVDPRPNFGDQLLECLMDQGGMVQEPLACLLGRSGQTRPLAAQIDEPEQHWIRFFWATLKAAEDRLPVNVDAGANSTVSSFFLVEADFRHGHNPLSLLGFQSCLSYSIRPFPGSPSVFTP